MTTARTDIKLSETEVTVNRNSLDSDSKQLFGTILIGATIVYLAGLSSSKMLWYADFWNYVTFINGIKQDGFGPTTILMDGYEAYVPYWPYLALIALLSTGTGISAPLILSWTGLANAILIITSLRIALREITPFRDCSFYAVLAMLFVWGSSPWNYSNFFHIDILPLVLCYPASFALGTTFLASYNLSRFLRIHCTRHLVAFTILFLITALSHPITAIFMTAICASIITFHIQKAGWDKWISAVTIGIIICALVIACWPPFPMINLTDAPAYIDGPGSFMYSRVIPRTYPILLAVVATLIATGFSNLGDSHFFRTALMLSFVYCYGLFADHGSFGRVISFLIISLQCFCAERLIDIERRLTARNLHYLARLPFFAACSLSIAFLAPTISRLSSLPENSYNSCKQVSSISHLIERSEVILNNSELSPCFLSLGARTVALHDEYSLPRGVTEFRREVVSRFFSPNTSHLERTRTVEQFEVSKIFYQIDRATSSQSLIDQLKELGNILSLTDSYILISTKGSNSTNGTTPVK